MKNFSKFGFWLFGLVLVGCAPVPPDLVLHHMATSEFERPVEFDDSADFNGPVTIHDGPTVITGPVKIDGPLEVTGTITGGTIVSEGDVIAEDDVISNDNVVEYNDNPDDDDNYNFNDNGNDNTNGNTNGNDNGNDNNNGNHNGNDNTDDDPDPLSLSMQTLNGQIEFAINSTVYVTATAYGGEAPYTLHCLAPNGVITDKSESYDGVFELQLLFDMPGSGTWNCQVTDANNWKATSFVSLVVE